MPAAQTALQIARTYYRRFLGLGWSRILLILAALFTLIALASPVWSTTLDHGGGSYDTATYGWTTVTVVSYEGGGWSQTLIQAYSASGFPAGPLANAAAGSYVAALVFLIVLVAAIVLFSLDWTRQLPSLGLLVIALVVLVVALVALLYPVLTVPPAATSDPRLSAVTGFWGSTPVGGATRSWGAALGWWSLLVGVLLGIVGGAWPFLKALRSPVARVPPPPQREWQVER